ncbi:hypothetical protein BDD12DRAFT_111850 [Trichophaea hybrida]|nr:hypothetical protein BDD12DRAFT_111850 [Trichophaea hybrida]
MYTPVRTFLRSLLDKAQYRVFDTHANDFLNNRKPDITISSAVLRDPHPIYVTTLIELKATTKDIDAKAMGQGLDYLERLVSSQPQRQQFTILISNLHCNRFIQYSRGGFGSQHKITSFSPCDFVTAMQFLNDIVHDHNEQPEIPQFSPGLGVMQAHLGSTAYNIVASFRTPSETLPAMSWVSHIPFFDSLDLIAVKRRRRAPQAPEDTLAREIGLLKLIANVKHLPTILFHNSTFTEYAATPVGRPADPKYLNNHSSLSQQILTDVLTALIYLHENNIIHRDLRWDNIVEYEGRGYLIDLGSAVPASPRIEQKYFGGYICCPPRIAGSINTPYTPEKADDYHAYVLLVNTMLFPASTRGFNSVRLEDPTSDESKRFGSFWRRLKRSVVWGRYVTAAETGDVQLLGQMPEMVVMMESCEEPGDLTIQPEWEEIGTEGEEEGESAEEGVGAVPLLEEFEKLMRERGTDEGKEVD